MGVSRPAFGADHLNRFFFDVSRVGEWAADRGAEIAFSPSASAGRVTTTEHEIVVRY